MIKIDLYNQQGEKLKEVTLNKDFFGAPIRVGLMHEAVVLKLANARAAIAHTKLRGEVRASTRKIYKQKGTGNARHGAKSANLFKGGGVTFGPRNERNFTKQMPKKMRRAALCSALSSRVNDKAVIGLDKYEVSEIKTKEFAAMLKKLPPARNHLLVIASKNEFIEKSARNLPHVKTLLVNYLNVTDLLKFKQIIFLEEAIDKLPEIFKIKPVTPQS